MKAIQRYKLPFILGVVGGIFLAVGLLFPGLDERAKGFVGNLLATAVGIFIGSAITVAVIDELLARRERRSKVERILERVEGLLFDVAARSLWGSQTYEPGDLETDSTTDRFGLEPWPRIITLLSSNSEWNVVRLGANQPAPDELTRLSPRIWDIISVPPDAFPNQNVARKAAVVAMSADDLQRIADEYIPELINDLYDARASSAVITHWVGVIRNTHLPTVDKVFPDHFFPHIAGAIWEVLILLDDAFNEIPHPLRTRGEEQVSDDKIT